MKLEEKVFGYRCFACGKEHPLGGAEYLCPGCGGNLEIVYDYGRIGKKAGSRAAPAGRRPRGASASSGMPGFPRCGERSVWRYELLLPLRDGDGRPPLHIGWTPLYRVEGLAAKLGVRELYVKDDGRNPSGSAKDRAGAVVIAHARERGIGRIVCASTGNAASSLACLCAPLGIRTALLVPASAPRAKIAQLMVYGAFVITVDGSYDDAYELSLSASAEYGWYNRNTGYNPFTREGKKTLSYEVCEQLGWECPDMVFVPVGDGNLLSGVWKGFRDLFAIGRISKLPRLVACQAAGSDAVKRAFESGGKLEPVSGKTIADSVSVKLPRDWLAAVRALEQSGGCAISVDDGDILDAVRELAGETGVFAEPAGALPLAALRKACAGGIAGGNGRVVLLVTGNGLKDVDPVKDSMPAPLRIKPEPGELGRVFARLATQ
jgi:threonine synthase